MISDKALELNISLVLEVCGDSVECTGIRVIKPGGGLAGNGIDPHRAITRIGKEISGTNGVPPWCVSHEHVLGKRPAQDGAQHEEKKEELIGTTADCRNTWIFKASSACSHIRSAVRTFREHTWLVQQHKEQIKLGDRVYVWESGLRGGIIGLAEVSEPPRIQPEPKEQLLFIRNSEKSRGDRLRVKIRLLKLIEPAIQRTYLSSRAEFATLSILRRPRGTNFRVTREEAKALEGIVDGMAVAAAPHASVQGEKRIVFAQA
ncbi:MAG TPA: EVE domain-containing protein [Candidatus Bathyarchaeia archaeon]|nr:EVE domain-containing protein [Candidatus Bathyarchaeia archaeon]